VWALYLEWVEAFGVVETAVKVYRRYLMFDPAHTEAYVDYLDQVRRERFNKE
jgi:pre-mRNA-splicing factor SYF1